MAKVKAAYNYSYNYEGKKISFKKDEEFQLLTKSNKDWWQVRRWMDGLAQDIYVPAVYVKEVSENKPAESAKESTYMNLDDLKIPSKTIQNGKSPAESPAEKSLEQPVVLSKVKKTSSFKKQSTLERLNESISQGPPPSVSKQSTLERLNDSASNSSQDPQSNSSSSVKSNGLNPGKPVSPTMLQRLATNRGTQFTVPSPPVSDSQVGQGSMKRGEKLSIPPPTKPRSKSSTNVDMSMNNSVNSSESSLDSGVRNQQQPQKSGIGGSSKSKPPPPPVQIKPKPQRLSSRNRPASCMVPATPESENATDKTSPKDITEGSKLVVSELSRNLMMKANPHLVNEHKGLMKTASGPLDSSSSSRGHMVTGGEMPGRSLSAKNVSDAEVSHACY